MQATSIAAALNALGLNRGSVARLAEPGDNLRSALAPTREARHSDDPVAVAMRLLFCGISVPAKEALSALGSPLIEDLKSAGILQVEGEAFAAPYHLRLVRGLFLFSDYLSFDSPPDAVMGAGETTAVLYGAGQPSKRVRRALDLGCGAGTLALLLARDCEHVIGTDINPRAIELSGLNATVNGILNARFLTGSLWEPVEGERFDLIVSQPPYYPRSATPGELTYLHGGARGDELPLAVANGVRDHLAPHGRALVFTSWPEDREPIAPEMQVLELTTNRRELSGARQCIDVIEHPSSTPWFLQTEVSAERWGNVRPGHIDRLNENGNCLATSGIEGQRFALAPGLTLRHDSEQAGHEQAMILGDPGALLSMQPLSITDAQNLARLSQGQTAPADAIREYLRKGWLILCNG